MVERPGNNTPASVVTLNEQISPRAREGDGFHGCYVKTPDSRSNEETIKPWLKCPTHFNVNLLHLLIVDSR